MIIKTDDLRGPEIAELLESHLSEMRKISPPGHVHALDLQAMRDAPLTMWVAWDDETIMGCGALLELGPEHGEIKSMRTARGYERRGVGAAILTTIFDAARARGYNRLSLETGATQPFEPAISMYRKFGFAPCAPFSHYTENDFSRCFTVELTPS